MNKKRIITNWNDVKHHLKTRDYFWKWKIFFILPLIIFLIGCDILTKQLALKYLPIGEVKPFWKGVVDFQRTFNPGVAFGFQAPLAVTVILGVLIVIVATIFLLYLNNKSLTASLAFVWAGGMGNLIDRMFHNGKVVDFLLWQITSPHTIFNIADVFVILGIILLILSIIIEYIISVIKEKKAVKKIEITVKPSNDKPPNSTKQTATVSNQEAIKKQTLHHEPPK